jgi:hypothetical protein
MKYLTVIILIFFTNIYSQNTPEDLIDKFFKTYISSGSTEALSELYATNPWMERIKDDLEKVKSQLEGVINIVGDYYGKDLIVKKELGKSFVLISYLVKYDRQPIRFTFEFYKPNDTWRAFGFSYDDNFDDEVEEAAKLYYLKDLHD